MALEVGPLGGVTTCVGCTEGASRPMALVVQPVCAVRASMVVCMHADGAVRVQPMCAAVYAGMAVCMHAADAAMHADGAARVQPMCAVRVGMAVRLHAVSVQPMRAVHVSVAARLHADSAANAITCVGCTEGAGKLKELVMQLVCAAQLRCMAVHMHVDGTACSMHAGVRRVGVAGAACACSLATPCWRCLGRVLAPEAPLMLHR